MALVDQRQLTAKAHRGSRLVTGADRTRRAVPVTAAKTCRHSGHLSFDDGPDPSWTPEVLDALAEAGTQATFFMMGYNVDRHRDLAHRVLDEGHEIGNRTWSHQDLAFQDPESTRDQIVDG